jgi:RNA polymerase subunit RPABC4/transcription elongation factor Spt4
MKKAVDDICPTCGGDVPNTEHKGEYPGALSRVDNETEICSACGLREALMGVMR